MDIQSIKRRAGSNSLRFAPLVCCGLRPLRFPQGRGLRPHPSAPPPFGRALAFFKSLLLLLIGTSPILLLKSINAPSGKLCYIIFVLIRPLPSVGVVVKTVIM